MVLVTCRGERERSLRRRAASNKSKDQALAFTLNTLKRCGVGHGNDSSNAAKKERGGKRGCPNQPRCT